MSLPREHTMKHGGKRPSRLFLRPCLLLSVMVFVVALSACSSQKGLFQTRPPAPGELKDDSSPAGLLEAVDQSIRYYLRLPSSRRFTYGELEYSPDEMIASMLFFRNLVLNSPDQESFLKEVTGKFHFFDSVREEGDNLFTGYYEPLIPGSPQPRGNLKMPIYTRPENMVEINLSDFDDDLPNRRLVGRQEGNSIVPFYTRQEIQGREALNGKAQVLAYVDEVDLFFLQIQGSGAIRFPDGTEIKVGYEASNGHPYRSIGSQLIQKNIIPAEEMSLHRIRAYLAENPQSKRDLLFTNPSYVFFSIRPEGPLGHISVPLTPGRSLALDKRLFPAGSLAFVSTEVPVPFDTVKTRPFNRFMTVQDTGGAIRGHGRGDLFWGNGQEAEWIAGHLKHTGRLMLLVAKKEHLRPYLASSP
ncbi:MAG: MltA domain-containing protein [Deltaproteobacteria bacterium]|nr:MltA domain-containing protein [Deltaproteobacteria bacterium]